jgi:hypothetical protein
MKGTQAALTFIRDYWSERTQLVNWNAKVSSVKGGTSL